MLTRSNRCWCRLRALAAGLGERAVELRGGAPPAAARLAHRATRCRAVGLSREQGPREITLHAVQDASGTRPVLGKRAYPRKYWQCSNRTVLKSASSAFAGSEGYRSCVWLIWNYLYRVRSCSGTRRVRGFAHARLLCPSPASPTRRCVARRGARRGGLGLRSPRAARLHAELHQRSGPGRAPASETGCMYVNTH